MGLTIRHFAALFFPVALFVVVGAAFYLHADRTARVEAIKIREAARLGREAEIFMAIMESRAADAAFLAAHITDMLQDSGEDGHEHIAGLLWSFAAHKRWNTQVRFLDARGRESVRLNIGPEGPARVPDTELQDKSRTAYFQKASGVPFGQVHVSRFDLNVEHGKIEEPWRPVLRMSSPVMGPDNTFAGLVVLNLDGHIPLNRLRQAATAALGRPLLVNEQGYWLLGPSPDLEWGFQVKDGREGAMDAVWPGVWDTIREGGRGQFFHDGALYTFETIKGDSPGWLGSSPVRLAEESWRLVARVDPADMLPPLDTVFVVLTGVLLVLLGSVSWMWASGRARRAVIQAALAASEEKFRAMSEASRDALVMIDDQARVAFWNRSAENMFGLSREKMLGRLLHDVVAQPEDLDKVRAGFPGFADKGRGKVVDTITEVTARRGDGGLFPVELSVAAFRHEGRWWAVGAARDVSERKRTEELLVRLATTDGLTGLFNRRRFLEASEAELERSNRYGHPASLLMFDVDHFKSINDTRGHDAGDRVLTALGRIARETLRTVDILGRIGGEEFAALLPETGLEEAARIAERLRRAVSAMELDTGAAPLSVTISLGVAQWTGPGEDLEALLKRADEAMYRAKEAGRDRAELG
ncbi:sensor domain-containing diguanylate cyclase [Desulfolutivibrio sulfoxidireducens]|uniref:sensor domain-containing diguanylate cyclase n=1 Tax=Desulfolutivibrio sulfoxidireducens TaxID=2773299 RepID=UPI00159D2835|nr:diguanylate cyclase [Desulfolutivibrio sulfoxidireducens]QLA18710.1 diguanylate cyclase [Desulfolutivibrio sulfoxidireducens]